jgi:hypothetical protein
MRTVRFYEDATGTMIEIERVTRRRTLRALRFRIVIVDDQDPYWREFERRVAVRAARMFDERRA